MRLSNPCLWRCWFAMLVLLMLSGCAFPKRDYVFMPDETVIGMQLQDDGALVLQPPHCGALFNEPRRPLFDSRPQAAFGCATYSNLSNSLARPEDLIAPKPYANQDAMDAVNAVDRYHQNQVTPLRETSATQERR